MTVHEFPSGVVMTERQRVHGLLILSAMDETLKKVQADFAALQKAADDFRRDFEAWQSARGKQS